MKEMMERGTVNSPFDYESSTFPLLHHLHKISEKRVRIVRSWRGLRVVLHRKEWHGLVSHAFQSAVIQIEVRHLDFALFERVRIDREIVIVRCDLDLSCALLANRMVAAVMSKLQLVSFSAERQSD